MKLMAYAGQSGQPKTPLDEVIPFLEKEAGIMLPAFEERQHIEEFYLGHTAQAGAKIVALPGNVVVVQQVNNRRPIQGSRRGFSGSDATRGTGKKGQAIG